MKTKYIADDGTEFDSASDARKYEAGKYVEIIGNATAEDVAAAVKGQKNDLAEAIKRAHNEIRQGRLDRNEVKPRKSKLAVDPAHLAVVDPAPLASDGSKRKRREGAAAVAA